MDGSCPAEHRCGAGKCVEGAKRSTCGYSFSCEVGEVCLTSGGCAGADASCSSGWRYASEVTEAKIGYGSCVAANALESYDYSYGNYYYCGGAWIQYETRAHCGGCDKSCAPTQVCTSQACVPCSKTICGEACVDVSSDKANCGACGNACAAGSVCTAGACECAGGFTRCGAGCLDLVNWDRSEAQTAWVATTTPCGSCDSFCKWGEYCTGGTCAPCSNLGSSWQGCSSSNGSTWICADLLQNKYQCGRCGHTCYNGHCSGGACSQ